MVKSWSLVATVKLIYNIEEALSALTRSMTPSLDPTEDIFVLYPNTRNSIVFSRSFLSIITKKSSQIGNGMEIKTSGAFLQRNVPSCNCDKK